MADSTGGLIGLVPLLVTAGLVMNLERQTLGRSSPSGYRPSYGYKQMGVRSMRLL